jgi:hypothetical protein
MNNNNFSPDNQGPESWFTLIKQSRRKYSYNKLRELNELSLSSIKRVLKWIYMDLIFIIQQSKKIYAEIQLYGLPIKNQYEISITEQVLQQLYLVFFLRVSLKHYRGYLLFKKDRWAMAQQFTYENYPVQMKLVNNTFPEERQVFDNKLSFHRHCLQNKIYSPPVFGVYKDGREILSKKQPFELPNEDLFVKELCGRRGQGITKYIFNDGIYNSGVNTGLSSYELIKLLQTKSRNNQGMMIQKPLQNHEQWQKFTSGALSTCRVLTGMSPESSKVSALAATLRMPAGSTITDNTSTGGIACAVDIETGILGKGIRKTPLNGRYEFDRQPDTNQLVYGTKVPSWDEMMEFAMRAHASFSTAFVGWDIALTTEGFALIEGNIGWSVRVIESPQGRALFQTQFPILYDGWMKKQKR